MLKVAQLSVAFGRHRVISGASFEVQAGQSVALLGRNGSGKTTLIRALAGLLPTSGSIWLDKTELSALAPHARGSNVGYVAQDLSILATHLSVFELLVLAQNSHVMGWRIRPKPSPRRRPSLKPSTYGRLPKLRWRNFPAGNGKWWRWHWPWFVSRDCCFWTNRLRPSISQINCICWHLYAITPAGMASLP